MSLAPLPSATWLSTVADSPLTSSAPMSLMPANSAGVSGRPCASSSTRPLASIHSQEPSRWRTVDLDLDAFSPPGQRLGEDALVEQAARALAAAHGSMRH